MTIASVGEARDVVGGVSGKMVTLPSAGDVDVTNGP
jgi:hypothetical protein